MLGKILVFLVVETKGAEGRYETQHRKYLEPKLIDKVKLPLVASVGPPGPCMTPSIERKVRTTIFLMGKVLL
jgi:hypothetical protein